MDTINDLGRKLTQLQISNSMLVAANGQLEKTKAQLEGQVKQLQMQ